MLTVKESGSQGASCQPSSSVWTWRPPLPRWRSSTVTVPKSVCGPILNWPGSGGPTTSVPGYQLTLKPQVGWRVCRVNRSPGPPSAAASSSSRWSESPRIRATYALTSGRSRGASAYQTLGRNHSASTAGSPLGSSAAKDQDSFRSGGVAVPSA